MHIVLVCSYTYMTISAAVWLHENVRDFENGDGGMQRHSLNGITARKWGRAVLRSKAVTVVAVILVGCTAAAGINYLRILSVPDPVSDAAERAEAQRQWLELVARDGDDALNGKANAELLLRCFKQGDEASSYQQILATGRKAMHEDGMEGFSWYFDVDKGPGIDATGFIVYVDVGGCPPVLKWVGGSYTVD